MMRRRFLGIGAYRNTVMEDGCRIHRIGVVGTGYGSGTTTIAAALAGWYSQRYYLNFGPARVAMVQIDPFKNPVNLLYEKVEMSQRMGRRGFVDATALFFAQKRIVDVHNDWAGVNWVIPSTCPQDEFMSSKSAHNVDETDSETILKNSYHDLGAALMQGCYGETIIYDMGQGHGKETALMQMDLVLGVVDPMPSKIIGNSEDIISIEKARQNGCNLIWIVNKYNTGVTRRDIRKLLQGGNIKWLEAFPIELVYGADFGCKFLWEDAEIRKIMWKFFDSIVDMLE